MLNPSMRDQNVGRLSNLAIVSTSEKKRFRADVALFPDRS